MQPQRRKLLFLVSADHYFCSHRLPLALAAQSAGYDVLVLTRVRDHAGKITQHGLRLFPIPFSRSGSRPWVDFLSFFAVLRIYFRERPDIVHHVSLKPILLGAICARLVHVPHTVNAFTGLGFVFSATSFFARCIRTLITPLLHILLNHRTVHNIFQNADDLNLLQRSNILSGNNHSLIRGSGVDTNLFQPRPQTTDTPIVMLAARMLWDKGVGGFVAAAQILLREVVRPDSGILVPARSSDPLAGAIRELLNDPERAKRLGQAGRQMVVDEFSSERIAAETLATYQSLLTD